MKNLNLITLILLFITTTLLSNTDRALYIKQHSNESKTALIIGNSKYKHFSKLQNTKNDAHDMQKILKSQGFDVLYLKDGSLKDMKKIVRKFTKKLRNGGVGFFYYSGHGLEVDGKNYLIPTTANIPEKDEVEFEALPMNLIINKMENSNNRLNIVVLDACRNDPYTKSGGGGLAQINNAKGMYIAFATAPGSVASDGNKNERNGLFTKHLIKNIKKSNLTLNQVFKKTRTSVYDESNDKQLPWTSSSVIGDFYFKVDSSNIAPEPKRKEYPKKTKQKIVKRQISNSNVNNEEKTFWGMVIDEDTKEYYTMYLEEYPNGYYLNEANNKIQEYKQREKLKQKMKMKTLWNNIKDSKSEKVFKKFIKNHPNSIYTKIAKLKAKKYKNLVIKDKYGDIYKEVTSPYTSKIWLDRNLGASRVCQSLDDKKCYGYYFQWGRNSDGHEKKSSKITKEQALNVVNVGHDKFIVAYGKKNFDWGYKSDKNADVRIENWNPCPKNFKIPSINELLNETTYNNINNKNEVFNSFLKLPSAGRRGNHNKFHRISEEGGYWTINIRKKYSKYLIFDNNILKENKYDWYDGRANGHSVRCIKREK